MKVKLKTLAAALLLSCGALPAAAQTDVTDQYLKNAGFDTNFDYPASATGNVKQEILEVDGWTKDFTAEYTITGVYQFGTAKTFNSAPVPATGSDGTSGGGALALSTGWGEHLRFYQNVSLPDGRYALVTSFYNSHTVTAGQSLTGWIPEEGDSVMSTLEAFPSNRWVQDTIFFYVTGETTGRIQIGLLSIFGSGSGSTAKLLLDYVKLLDYGVDKSELQALITDAAGLYGTGEGNEAAALKTQIDAATEIDARTDATMKEVLDAMDMLKQAMDNYRLANGEVLDVSFHISNPSFEDDGLNGWVNEGMQSQGNSSFTEKVGSTYAEKYASKGSHVADCSLTQTISGLDNGRYILKAAAQNVQQGIDEEQQGAYLFANRCSTEVTAAAGDYEVDFIVVEGEARIGFKAENATGNWVSCDNFRLYFAGSDPALLQAELAARVEEAEELAGKPMKNDILAELREATAAVEALIATPADANVPAAARNLRDIAEKAEASAQNYAELQAAIDEAVETYGDGSLTGAADFLIAIEAAKDSVANLEAEPESLAEAMAALAEATLMFRTANATGAVPEVTTNPFVARGSTMAFGRSTIEGVEPGELREHGFCWSTEPDPTIYDNRSTRYYSNNGYVYRMDNLAPSTFYYVRAYAITKNYAVGYGETVRIPTLPKGNISWSYNNGGPADDNERINAAVRSAVDYWNNLTAIDGLRLTVNYGSGTPTADCSYGGWMRVGPNASYQRTGTIMHEMGHAVGVGTHSVWWGVLKPGGQWLGERVTRLMQFIDNDPAAVLKGDSQHMWPYGINGAHEDTGNEFLYIANGLITQALGEDGLPPTGGFATPGYAFACEEGTKYYLKNEHKSYGLYTSYLAEDSEGRLSWHALTAAEATANDSAAWYLHYDPDSCYYQFRNAATGKYISFQEAGTNGIRPVATEQPSKKENFQLIEWYEAVDLGKGATGADYKGFWIICPQKMSNPPTLTAQADGATGTTNFKLDGATASQRWLILTADEVQAFEQTTESLMLADLRVNGSTIAGFSSEKTAYRYSVDPDATASEFVVTAEKSNNFSGTIEVTQPQDIPGRATVTASTADGKTTVYTIDFLENYAYRWDGQGATGSGSKPSNFGWDASPSVTWQEANAAYNRYVDPGQSQYTGYTLDGETYDQNRILWIRYNNDEEFTYTFSGLEAGKDYAFSFNYGWHNNGSRPQLTVGVREKDGTTLFHEEQYTASATKRVLTSGGFTFRVPEDCDAEEFCISIRNAGNNDCMVIIADLSVTDTELPTGISLVEQDGTGPRLLVEEAEGGAYLSSPSGQRQATVYRIDGTAAATLSLGSEKVFLPLQPGIYIVEQTKFAVR